MLYAVITETDCSYHAPKVRKSAKFYFYDIDFLKSTRALGSIPKIPLMTLAA